MPDPIIKLFDFSGGYVDSVNPLDYPRNAISAGEDVSVKNRGVVTRPGCSMTSTGSLPVGEVQVSQQVRFPSTGQKYTIAQVGRSPGEPPTWRVASLARWHSEHAAIWDPETGLMLLVGGSVNEESSGFSSYDLINDTWSDLSLVDGPSPVLLGSKAIYDPIDRRMLVSGGVLNVFNEQSMESIWAYDLDAGTWSTITTTGDIPDARYRHFAIYNSNDHTMVVCGGTANLLSLPTNPYYVLDLATMVWTAVGGAGAVFSNERGAGAAAFDPVRNWMIICGGLYAHGEEETWILDLTTATWSAGTNMPVEVSAQAAIYFNGKVISVGGQENGVASDDWQHLFMVYDIATDTWTQPTSVPAPDIDYPLFGYNTLVVTETGTMIAHLGGIAGGGYNLVMDADFALYGASGRPASTELYASPTNLPTTTAVFTKIADLTQYAEPVSITTLNDRAIVANLKDYELVFSGGMDSTGADWAFPIYALLSYDGVHLHDVSSDVCDSDVNTYADIGNMAAAGFLGIVTDVPELLGFYFEMQTANAGLAGITSAFSGISEYLTDDYAGKIDLKSTITTFTRDAAATGHFNTAITNVAVGTLIVFDDDTVATIIAKVSDGTHANDITIDADHATGTVSAIYGIVVADEKLSPNFSVTALASIFSKSASAKANYPNTSIRQVISAAETTGGGSGRIRLIFRAGDKPFKLGYCSIVEQDVDQDGTTTPTTITFNGGSYGIEAAAEIPENNLATVTTAPAYFGAGVSSGTRTVYPTYTKDATAVGHFSAEQTSAAVGNMIVFSDNTIAIIESITPPGTGGSEIGLDRDHATGTIKAIYPAIMSDPIIYDVDGAKAYIVSMDVDGLSVTEEVHPRFQSGGSAGAVTTRIVEVGGLASAAGAGCYTKTWDGSEIGACYDQDVVTGFAEITGVCVGVVEIQADTIHPLPTLLQVSHTTDENQISLTYADAVDSITITQETPGNSKIYWAFSFDGRLTVNIWKAGAWLPIIQFTTLWQYWDGAAWQNATINSLEGAEVQAFAVAGNKIEKAAYEALTTADWMDTGGVDFTKSRVFDCFQAFLCDGQNLPRVTGVVVGYSGQSVVRVDVRQNGAWVTVAATDNTEVAGVSLGQTGTMTFASTTADYDVIDGIAGFHWRIWTNGTSAGTAISQIKYKAPCQALQNIGTGQPDTVAGAYYYDTSEEQPIDMGVILSDYVETDLSSVTIPMATDDYLYFGYLTQFNALAITPLAGAENQTTSTMSVEHWNGQSWVLLDINDGTSSGGKTLHKQGTVIWPLPADWKESIPVEADYPRAYWVRLSVSSSLTATTALVEARVYPVPDIIKKHRLAEVVGNRLALAGTAAEPDRVDISQEFKEYGFNGPDSGSWRVGGQDSAIAMIAAWNGLFVAKPESWHSFNGRTFDTIEASGKTPINDRVLVKAPAPGDQSGSLSGLYFLNEKGAHVAASLQADNAQGTARISLISDNVAWWDDDADTRIDKNWLFRASGVYWPLDDLILWSVPMIVDGAAEQQTCNRILVYDLGLRCWYPPWKITAASLMVAYHHNANAPGGLGPLGIYAGDYAGQIVRLMYGETDLGVAVQGWFETGFLDLGMSEAEKIGNRIRLYGHSDTNVQVAVTVDGETSVRPGYSATIPGLTGLTGKFLGADKDIKKTFYGNFVKLGIHFAGYTDLYGVEIEVIADTEELQRK